MPSILALDQGTTGSTALVVHQDGQRARPRLPRVHPVLSPSPAGSSTIPRRSCGSRSRRCARRWPARASDPRASASPTSARPSCSGTGATLAPVGRARSSGRTAAPATRCRELRESGAETTAPRAHRPRGRSLLLRHQARVAAARPATFAAAPERGELAAGTVESWLVARLTGGRVHVTDHTNASRTLLYDLAARAWDPELLALFGVPPATAARASCRRRDVSARPTPEHLGFAPADRRTRRRPAGGAVRPGLLPRTGSPRTPTGPARSCWCFTGDQSAAAGAGRARPPRPADPAASRPTRSRAASSSPAPRCSGCATGWASSRRPAETRGAGAQRPRYRRRALRAGIRGAGHAALGGRRARHDHRPHARHHPRAPGARGARVDGVQQRRPARRP